MCLPLMLIWGELKKAQGLIQYSEILTYFNRLERYISLEGTGNTLYHDTDCRGEGNERGYREKLVPANYAPTLRERGRAENKLVAECDTSFDA